MPSKSPAQLKAMRAAAHNPQFAKKVGIPQNVAQDFNAADDGSTKMKQALAKRNSKKKNGKPNPFAKS